MAAAQPIPSEVSLDEMPQRTPLARLDFESDLFDDMLTHCLGDGIVERARELRSTTAFRQTLERGFEAVDTGAADLATAMSRTPAIKLQYETAVRNGLGAVEAAEPEVERFFNWAERLPPALDREMIERGGEVFRRNMGTAGLMLYGMPAGMTLPAMIASITLPLWYTLQRSGPALPLHLVGKQAEVQRRNAVRFMETFRWLGSVSAPGAGHLHTDPYSEDCRVRIIHGHVRGALERKSGNWNYSPPLGWNSGALGAPFSAADGSIVTMVLVLALSAMRKNLRLVISDHDMDALSQWACYVNYQQGVPDEFMFSTFDETMTYFAAYFLSVNPYVHNAECVGMINSVRHMHLERAMYPGSRALQTVLDGINQASIATMFGARVREVYDMPAPPAWSRPLYFLVRCGLTAVNTASRYVPAIKRCLESRAEKTWTKVFPEAEKAVRKHYGAVAKGTHLKFAG
jgi:hypothetical protein